jgi:hypothetical protein
VRGSPAPDLSQFPVVIARGIHLFPFRTEQLSPSAPMVLGPHGPGRVGRRRINLERPPHRGGLSRLISRWAPSIWGPECGYNRRFNGPPVPSLAPPCRDLPRAAGDPGDCAAQGGQRRECSQACASLNGASLNGASLKGSVAWDRRRTRNRTAWGCQSWDRGPGEGPGLTKRGVHFGTCRS